MDYLRHRLLREIVKFLELCQKDMFDGKISLEEYQALTNNKFVFLGNMLEAEAGYYYMDDHLRGCINKLRINDDLICGSDWKAAAR